jgi:hypothetical protein
MKPILIGYFPMKTKKNLPDLKAVGVEEVCSVTDCVSDSPEGWIDQWKHNEMWVFDSVEIARSIIPEAQRHDFNIFGYYLFPERIPVKEPSLPEQKPFVIPSLHVEVMDNTFEKLGYDIVDRTAGNKFEHSPLSCNGLAGEVKVNRYCLIDDAEKAFQIAGQFENLGAESGPYYVIEVWRQKNKV